MEIVVFAIAALAALMGLIALAVPLARALGLPLPVVIAIAGISFGTAAAVYDFGIGRLALDSYDLWFLESLALDSSSILYAFLPPLLFEMALAVNVRRMLDEAGTVVLMAVFAVIAATAAIGLAVWALSPIGLFACLMLGAAVATTDPAAVITTFREIGAPRRLLVILEGESLLNDAAAIAIFAVLLAIVEGGGAVSPADAPLAFLYAFAVGGAVGLAVSFGASRLYPLLGRSEVAETSMTVALAYGAYLIAELVLGASGVVAVVFAGLATGSVGFVRMGPRNWSTVRAVWTQIGFWSNGLILILVSALVPPLLLSFTWEEVLLLPVVYLGAIAARALILFAVLPVIARGSPEGEMDARQKTLILWGGVRGAVTLVLAISLADTAALGEDAGKVGTLAAAFTLLTLLLNASTLAFVTHRLGLDRLSPGDLAIRERIVAGSIERVRSVISDLARRRALEPEALAAVEAALQAERREAESHAGEVRIPFGERLRLGLAMTAAQEGRLIRRGFEEGAIGPRAMTQLRLVSDRLADAARTGGRRGYEDACEAALKAARPLRWAVRVHRYTGWDRPLRSAIEIRQTCLLESERIVRELDRFVATTLWPMIGEDAAANIRDLLAWRRERTDAEIDATELQYPVYCAALERMLLTRAAIRRERQQFERLYADGIIGPELRDNLTSDLDRRERIVAQPPRLDLTLSREALFDRVPLFAGLDERQRRAVARRMKTRLAAPEELIVSAGERGDRMYFVASGVLEVRGGPEPVTLTTGDFFGEAALLQPQRRRQRTVVSLAFSRLLSLSRADFVALVGRDPEIGRLIEAASARKHAPGPPTGDRAKLDALGP